MRVLLAGLWTRRGMNATCLLVSVVAITAAVLGPMYGRASSEHLLDTRLDERAPYTTGLSVSRSADKNDTDDDPERYAAPPVSQLTHAAATQFSSATVKRYWPDPTAWAADPGGTFTYGALELVAPLYWREGMCDLARVVGRCPVRKDDALMQATMAATLHLRAGDTFRVRYLDSVVIRSRKVPLGAEKQVPRTETFRLTGTYRVTDPGSPAWFDLSRFAGAENLRVPAQRGTGGKASAPALLVAPASFTSQSWQAGVDRPLDPRRVDLADMDRVQRTAQAFKTAAVESADSTDSVVMPELDLTSIFDQVRSERTLLSRVMVAALAPLVALALLLLFALVSSAAQVRRPHVALAKLRGQTRRQVLWFALSEPFLVVLVATPLGVGLAALAARLFARGWLHEGIPVGFDTTTVLFLLVVVGASLAASTAAALSVVREPLAAGLASSVRPRPSSRVSLVLRSAVVAVALAAVANLLASGDQSSRLLALLTPMFLALAVAVFGAALLRSASRAWVRRTASRGGAPSYLASRRLARRGDLANLMVPLLLAVAVLAFAASTTATSDAWRVSRADAEVGAARSFDASVSPGRLVQVTHEVDPDGRYLMATVVNNGGDDMSRGVYVDSARLAKVASWDPSWSTRSVTELARRLRPQGSTPVMFTGHEVSMRLRDVSLHSATKVPSTLQLQYVDDLGEQRAAQLGTLRNGSAQTVTGRVEHCERACRLEQVFLAGSSFSVSDAQGRLTIASVAVDGQTADWGLGDGHWRPARPFPVSLVDPPVVATGSDAGLLLKVYLGRLPAGEGPQNAQVSGFARVTPGTTPDVKPVLVADGTRTTTARQPGSAIALDYDTSTVVGAGVNGQDAPVHLVGRVRALPVLGTEGELADLATSLVEFQPPAGALVTTRLWVAEGTPASVLAAVRAKGVALSDETDRATVLQDLRTDAFSLSLRLFLLVGVATLLLAIFGVLASAVLQSRWRSYEVASLRVVGVSRRSLSRASALEYVVLLGVAVVLGVAAAYLSLKLVLPAISLGTAGDQDPVPVYATHWPLVLGVGGGLFLLSVLIAVAVSRRITRLGRPSTLRWAEQG